MGTHVQVINHKNYPIPVRLQGFSVDGVVQREPLNGVLPPGESRQPVEVILRACELPVWRAYFKKPAKGDPILELVGADLEAFLKAHRPGMPGTDGAEETPIPWHAGAKVAELRAACESRGLESKAAGPDLVKALRKHDRKAKAAKTAKAPKAGRADKPAA